MQFDDYKDMCAKCKNQKACKTPCAFVEAILQKDNRTPAFEVKQTGPDNKPIVVTRNRRPEIGAVYFQNSDGENYSDDLIFTTEADNPFVHYRPKLNQTTVFIKRFFLKQSYEDIANELDVSVMVARSHFANAANRMVEALKYIDDRHKSIERTKSVLEKAGKLSKGQKWFIMNRLCGLTVPEIAEIEDATVGDVYIAINRLVYRIITGEEALLNPTQADIEQAQEWIEKKRAIARKSAQRARQRKSAQKKIQS